MSDAPRKAPARKSAPRRSKALAERLTQLVYYALSDAAETLLGVKGDEFSLRPLNPVRVVVAVLWVAALVWLLVSQGVLGV